MQFDAFISYPHQDKPTADAACASLESAGIRCWIAPRDVVPGRDWGEAIIDAIENAKVMVLIFSGHANASPQIKREVERAVNRGVAIIPVRIEDVVPNKSLEYFISTPHWLDAFTPPLESHLKRLATAVTTLITIGSVAPPEPPPVPPKPALPALSEIRRMFLSAQNAFDLSRARHSVEALLRREPDNIDALQLRDQINKAIGREEVLASVRTQRPRPSQTPMRRSLVWPAAVAAIALIFAIAAYSLVHGFGQQDLVRTIVTGVNPVDSVDVSADGTRIASGNWGGSIQILNLKDGRLLQSIAADHSGTAVPFSPDGSRIATGSNMNNVRIVDAVSGQTFRTLTGHTRKVMTVVFSPDGKRLASAGEDRIIDIWDVESGQLLRTLEGHGDTVRSVVFFPDGKRIVSGSRDQTVRVWNAETGETLFKFTEPTNRVFSVALSPDGKWIAAGGADGTVRGWDATTGQPLSRLIKRPVLVTSIAFSPDGQRIASAGYDGTLSISDAKSGNLIRNLMHPAPLAAVKFSPDGKWLVTAADDKSVRIWRAP